MIRSRPDIAASAVLNRRCGRSSDVRAALS